MKISPPPDLRILNFESAITNSIHNADVPSWKGIRYHTHVDNLESMMRAFVEETHGASEAASPVIMSFANNHAMDYGRQAFEEETIPALESASSLFQSVGAGRNWEKASKPAVVEFPDKNLLVEVVALGAGCSGVSEEWHAKPNRSGLIGLPGLYSQQAVEKALKITKDALKTHPSKTTKEGAIRHLRIASIHMGPNWAYRGETNEDARHRRDFVHALIDECGFDLIYGHSSHHVRGMEVYHGKLILYGTGDMINDYEGFENPGEEKYNRLGGIFVADFNTATANLEQLRIVPTFMNRLRLERYTPTSKIWGPNQRQLQVDPNKSRNMCQFINEMSELDAGGRETALLMEHVDSDPGIPGGPILISRMLPKVEC